MSKEKNLLKKYSVSNIQSISKRIEGHSFVDVSIGPVLHCIIGDGGDLWPESNDSHTL